MVSERERERVKGGLKVWQIVVVREYKVWRAVGKRNFCMVVENGVGLECFLF